VIVGEAPGQNEDQQGQPFVGAAGKLLDQLLIGIGLSRQDVFITNILKCRPPNNRDPQPIEVEACSPYLEHQLRLIKPEVVVLLGRHALGRLLPGQESITRMHGRVIIKDAVSYIPVYHPAAALYNNLLQGPLEQDFKAVRAHLDRMEERRRAAAVVATARGLREREATEKALHAGEVSFDQAQVIVQTTAGLGDAAGQAEQVLLEHAPGLDTARFRQFADEVAYRAYPDAAEEREQRRWDKRHLSFGLTLDSTGVLSGSCGDAVSYEIVRTAAEAFSPPAGQLDTRTAAQRRMDGLVAACRTALDGGSAPERHGNAPHITVLVKDETLAQATAQTASAGRAASAGPAAGAGTASSPADSPAPAPPADAPPGPITGPSAGLVTPVPPALITQASPGPATGTPGLITGTPGRITGAPGLITGGAAGRTGHGTLLTARQVLSLCCGAQISAIRWDNGLPLDVGRTARTEPPGLRRALEARDQGCRWTCCGALAAWATAHHIKPWSQGGATSLNDLALFCHLHHYFIHTLGWTITGDPNATLHLTHPGAGSPSTAPSPDAEPGSATPGQIVPTRRAPACPASTGRPARTARAPGMPPGVQLLRAMSERLARARGLGDRGGPVQPAQPGAVPLSQVQVGLDRVLDP